MILNELLTITVQICFAKCKALTKLPLNTIICDIKFVSDNYCHGYFIGYVDTLDQEDYCRRRSHCCTAGTYTVSYNI